MPPLPAPSRPPGRGGRTRTRRGTGRTCRHRPAASAPADRGAGQSPALTREQAASVPAAPSLRSRPPRGTWPRAAASSRQARQPDARSRSPARTRRRRDQTSPVPPAAALRAPHRTAAYPETGQSGRKRAEHQQHRAAPEQSTPPPTADPQPLSSSRHGSQAAHSMRAACALTALPAAASHATELADMREMFQTRPRGPDPAPPRRPGHPARRRRPAPAHHKAGTRTGHGARPGRRLDRPATGHRRQPHRRPSQLACARWDGTCGSTGSSTADHSRMTAAAPLCGVLSNQPCGPGYPA
jgi:hypothetical protein